MPVPANAELPSFVLTPASWPFPPNRPPLAASMNHITALDEPFLSADTLAEATRRYDRANWTITTRKLPISRALAIDQMAARVGIPIPEMIFGDNEVALCHRPTGWTIRFVAEDALDAVDKTGEGRLQVAHAADWARTRPMDSVEGIQDVRAYDWSYSTAYRGTEQMAVAVAVAVPPSSAASDAAASTGGRLDPPPPPPPAQPQQQTNGVPTVVVSVPPLRGPLGLVPAPDVDGLPLALLRQRDPILFNDDVLLYESELDDNGLSMVRVKLRVMPARLLLLCRLYMRLDHVVVRVRDTRVYVDLATDVVLREYTAREDAFARVRAGLATQRGLPPDAIVAAMRDADRVADLLPVVEHAMERVVLGPPTAPAVLQLQARAAEAAAAAAAAAGEGSA